MNERFDRIDRRLDRLEAGQNELRNDVRDLQAGQNELRNDVKELQAGQEELRSDVKELQAGQNELRNDVRELRNDVSELRADHGTLRTDLEDLGRHMRVLHEEVLDRISAIPEYSGPTKAEFAELKDMLGRRLDPLEATVHQHSREIEHLKQQRS